MLNKRNFWQIMPFALMVFTLLPSCKDETGTIGLDVLPPDDIFKGSDVSSYLPAKNANPINLRSDDADFAIIGSVEDEYAGNTNASFIAQVNIGAYIDNLNQGEDYFVDSLVLNLAYSKNTWFGNKNAKHNVQIHRLTEPLSQGEDYYSDINVGELGYDPAPLSERISSAWDELPDSVWDDNEYIHQWQFKLDDQLAEEIFNFSFPEGVSDARQAFQDSLNGFFIKSKPVDDTRGSLIRLNLLDSKSNMRLYYSYHGRDDNGEIDTTKQTSYTFPINIECVRINRFEHNHNDIIDFDNPNASEYVVQGMAGSMVEVNFNDVGIETDDNGPRDLFEFWEEKIDSESGLEEFYGISAVDIYFKADTILQNNDTLFHSPIPPNLRLYEMNNGKPEAPVYETDQPSQPIANGFIGGNYNSETAEYQFRMGGDYFRMMVQNPELRGPYYLAPRNPVSYPWRVILVNDDNVPYLRMKYVSIQNP